ncbi:MAG: AsmA family protein [Proteobacteria bacterium]|nr:AsmA family protein [Pseudomonadota bacterium]
MLKAIKLITKSLILFILILCIGGVLFVNLVNPNRFKTVITQEISKAIDKEVIIDGNIHWTFYPWLGLELDQVKVKNPTGFSEPFLATAQKLQLNLATLPLLKGQIHIGRIKIQKLNADLVTEANGHNNWQTTKTKKSTSNSNSNINVEKLHVSSVSIVDGHIHWKNVPAKQDITIDSLNFTGQYFAFNKEFPITAHFSIAEPQFSANVFLKIKMLLPEFVDAKQMIEQMQADGSLELNQVKVNHLHINQIQSTLSIRKGSIRLSPMQAEMYHGTASGLAQFTMNTSPSNFLIQQSLKQLNLGSLLQDTQKERSMEGTLDLDTKLSGSGNNLNGQMNFTIRNGVLKNVSIPQVIGLVTALIHQKMPVKNSKDTPFTSFTGTMNIDNNVMHSDNLVLNSPSFKITGVGTTNLNTKEIHYDLKVTLLDSDLGKSIVKLQQALGGGIPVLVRGTYDHYTVQPNYAAVTAVTAALLLEETGGQIVPAVKNVGDAVGKGVRDVGKVIKGIFH